MVRGGTDNGIKGGPGSGASGGVVGTVLRVVGGGVNCGIGTQNS